jgi:hypothetical protein
MLQLLKNKIYSFLKGEKKSKFTKIAPSTNLENLKQFRRTTDEYHYLQEVNRENEMREKLRLAIKTKSWLEDFVYDYVCSLHYGDGRIMSEYFEKIKELKDDATEKEVIYFKENVLGIL